jgi:hypothetical protein
VQSQKSPRLFGVEIVVSDPYLILFNLGNAVGREKDVQAIDLDSVMKKCVATLLVISIFSYSLMNQSLVQTFVILLRFLG